MELLGKERTRAAQVVCQIATLDLNRRRFDGNQLFRNGLACLFAELVRCYGK